MNLGSMAIHLGKKAEEFKTHQWVLYIRGPQDEDLSTFVEKVSFTLHPSFANPVRGIFECIVHCQSPLKVIVLPRCPITTIRDS